MTPHPNTDDPDDDRESAGGLQYGEHGRCTATAKHSGERCQRPAGANGVCRFHGRHATGPSDPSALEGNDHAAGNDGGGAPEGNTNALESGAFVPLHRIPERLTREQLHGVARWEWWAVLASRHYRPTLLERRRRRLAQQWAYLKVRQQTAGADVWVEGFGRGFVYERERTTEVDGDSVTWTETRANPSIRVECRASAKRLKIGSTLGLYDFDARRAEAADRRAAPHSVLPIGHGRDEDDSEER